MFSATSETEFAYETAGGHRTVTDLTPPALEAIWTEIRNSFRAEIGEACYQSWIAVLSAPSVSGGTVWMCVRLAVRD